MVMKTFQFDTAQKMNFSIKDVFSECHQIRKKLRIWSQLLKKSRSVKFFQYQSLELTKFVDQMIDSMNQENLSFYPRLGLPWENSLL